MDWKQSPEWATHKLTLEGGTVLWSTESSKEIILGAGENTQKIAVVEIQTRPEYKTFIHLRDAGKLVKYEVEGQIAHGAAKRLLKQSGYDLRGLRFVLEYEQIV